MILSRGRLSFVYPSTSNMLGSLPAASTSRSKLFMAVNEDKDDEIQRLKNMAAKLRAEAAALEAEQADMVANAARKAFEKFDTNQDGEISLAELKSGLEKALKTELPEKRVKKLLENFDQSGDGALQPEEFVTIEMLRNKLDAIARDEKAAALEMKKKAKLEEEALKFMQAQMEILNEREPTNTEKVVSVLPYLFPLLDSLQFAAFLVMENPENPAAQAIALLYFLYRSIPFGGFIAFFALSFLSGNPTINRQIRFNMQQAIYLDIALFFPGLIGAVGGLLTRGLGWTLPPSTTELASNGVFFAMFAILTYCSISSLLGQTPDKIPLISNAVKDRMPTIDMFDAATGRFLGRNREETDGNDDDDKNKKDE